MSAKKSTGFSSPRAANWTSEHDQVMLRIFKQERMLGNCNGVGQFTHNTWARIVPTFNRLTGLSLTKDKMKNRMKVLMRGFKLYNDLANTRGWFWDPVKHLPIPSEISDWDKMIARNPRYAKCRNRPFPAYSDIKLFYSKNTITAMPEDHVNDERDISFSSSNDEENTRTPTTDQNDRLLSPIPLRYADPLPCETRTAPHAAASVDGQPMKDHAGTHPLSSDKQMNSGSSGSTKRRKIENNSKALDELIELGKQRLEIAKALLNREAAAKPNLTSIGECISKLETIEGITPAAFLAACEAFKDEADRTIFMHLKEPVIRLWIERQVINQSCYPQCLNQYPSNNLLQQQPPKQ